MLDKMSSWRVLVLVSAALLTPQSQSQNLPGVQPMTLWVGPPNGTVFYSLSTSTPGSALTWYTSRDSCSYLSLDNYYNVTLAMPKDLDSLSFASNVTVYFNDNRPVSFVGLYQETNPEPKIWNGSDHWFFLDGTPFDFELYMMSYNVLFRGFDDNNGPRPYGHSPDQNGQNFGVIWDRMFDDHSDFLSIYDTTTPRFLCEVIPKAESLISMSCGMSVTFWPIPSNSTALEAEETCSSFTSVISRSMPGKDSLEGKVLVSNCLSDIFSGSSFPEFKLDYFLLKNNTGEFGCFSILENLWLNNSYCDPMAYVVCNVTNPNFVCNVTNPNFSVSFAEPSDLMDASYGMGITMAMSPIGVAILSSLSFQSSFSGIGGVSADFILADLQTFALMLFMNFKFPKLLGSLLAGVSLSLGFTTIDYSFLSDECNADQQKISIGISRLYRWFRASSVCQLFIGALLFCCSIIAFEAVVFGIFSMIKPKILLKSISMKEVLTRWLAIHLIITTLAATYSSIVFCTLSLLYFSQDLVALLFSVFLFIGVVIAFPISVFVILWKYKSSNKTLAIDVMLRFFIKDLKEPMRFFWLSDFALRIAMCLIALFLNSGIIQASLTASILAIHASGILVLKPYLNPVTTNARLISSIFRASAVLFLIAFDPRFSTSSTTAIVLQVFFIVLMIASILFPILYRVYKLLTTRVSFKSKSGPVVVYKD